MLISQFGGEAALINLIRDKYGAAPGGDLALGIGDDAALIRVGEKYLIVTTDLLIENTHFRMDINDAYLLGWKSVAVNISDVAAMGGEPTYTFVSIGLPDIDVETVDAIYAGMNDASNAFGSVIAGRGHGRQRVRDRDQCDPARDCRASQSSPPGWREAGRFDHRD